LSQLQSLCERQLQRARWQRLRLRRPLARRQ